MPAPILNPMRAYSNPLFEYLNRHDTHPTLRRVIGVSSFVVGVATLLLILNLGRENEVLDGLVLLVILCGGPLIFLFPTLLAFTAAATISKLTRHIQDFELLRVSPMGAKGIFYALFFTALYRVRVYMAVAVCFLLLFGLSIFLRADAQIGTGDVQIGSVESPQPDENSTRELSTRTAVTLMIGSMGALYLASGLIGVWAALKIRQIALVAPTAAALMFGIVIGLYFMSSLIDDLLDASETPNIIRPLSTALSCLLPAIAIAAGFYWAGFRVLRRANAA